MLATLHVGGQIETTTPKELHRALLDQDARLRADLSGVKWAEMNLNTVQLGTPGQVYTSTGTSEQSPSAGYLWSVMTVGVELSTASQIRLYKGNPVPSGGTAPTGRGGFVSTLPNFVTTFGQFSKGQFVLRSGDYWTMVMPTAGNILSVYFAYIEVPSEQQGKLWL